jgi:hypothetical protein
VFNFLESPKFLLGRGKEAEAIEVLHKIARFNRAPPPTLTVDDFAEIDQTMSQTSDPTSTAPLNTRTTAKKVVRESVQRIKHLKGLFETKLAAFTFAVLAIAYMGDFWSFNLAGEWWCVDCRIIKGDHPCQSFPLLTATGSFLPIILARNNVSSGTQTVTDTYRQYIYIYLPGILGCIMAMGAVNLPIVGRKVSCPARCPSGVWIGAFRLIDTLAPLVVVARLWCGTARIVHGDVYPGQDDGWLRRSQRVGVHHAERESVVIGLSRVLINRSAKPPPTSCTSSQFFNAVLYATTPELFPAYVRGSACGLLSTIGRLSGIVAPFAGTFGPLRLRNISQRAN